MDKNSNYWFTAIYVIAVACYLGIFYPETDPFVAMLGGSVAALMMLSISYILNR